MFGCTGFGGGICCLSTLRCPPGDVKLSTSRDRAVCIMRLRCLHQEVDKQLFAGAGNPRLVGNVTIRFHFMGYILA